MNENQKSISDWIEESYPGASMERRLKHLFEEVTELALKLEPGLDIAHIQTIIAHTARKAAQSTDNDIGEEVADVRIALSGIATHAGIDEQEALDGKMQENRARSLEERQRREAAKQGLHFFKS